ncbi:MAG: phosphatase PAP2 family protein [Flavobacteriaceae bacterium]|nr:phosphatase PAP2 family protein [Flavobacteriaceae bacterium]
MIEELLTYDTQLFQYLNQLGTPTWDRFWQIVTLKWSSIPLYIALLVLIYKELGLKMTLYILLLIAILITCSDQLANLFKYGIKRPRPCQVESLQETIRFVAVRCGRYGFYSAHAANSMAVAVFVSLLLRSRYAYLPLILMVWAVTVAYSRIYLGVHYPLDIFTGMFFGSLLGGLFYGIWKLLSARLSRNNI